MIRAVVAILLFVPALAHAGEAQAPGHEDDRYALAWTVPIRAGISGSAYVRSGAHQAIRLSVASYAYKWLTSAPGEDVDDPIPHGRFLDVSAGWMIFPRHAWDGLTLEGALLRRERHTFVDGLNSDVTRDSVTYAARGLVGWSWHFRNGAFIATAIGASFGYAEGERKTVEMRSLHDVETRSGVAPWEAAFECYVRVGHTFGGAR